jgi:hypothetical protein
MDAVQEEDALPPVDAPCAPSWSQEHCATGHPTEGQEGKCIRCGSLLAGVAPVMFHACAMFHAWSQTVFTQLGVCMRTPRCSLSPCARWAQVAQARNAGSKQWAQAGTSKPHAPQQQATRTSRR